MAERLDKLLSDAGHSRSEAKVYIKAGRVSVNGVVSKRAEEKYDINTDNICLDGKSIGQKMVYIMMNKPEDVISATEDTRQKTVIDLLPPEYKSRGVFPVGRLDKDATGLLLLTNDGVFSHSITSPNRHVAKRYEVLVDGMLSDADVAAFLAGIELRDGTVCKSAELVVDITNKQHATVKIEQGKYHQVKRMFAARGKPVISLKRLSIGGLELDKSLEPGDIRLLSEQELESIFS